MTARRAGPLGRWLAAVAAVLAAVAAVALLLRWAGQPPDGPVEVVWDDEACAECHMHIGDPRFAAQVQTEDGDVWSFDDPGCAMHLLATRRPRVRAVYFRHVRADRWIPRREVAFEPTRQSPMGYGLGAVERGTRGAISYEEAARRVEARIAARGADR